MDAASDIARQTGQNLGVVREELRTSGRGTGIIRVGDSVEVFDGSEITRRIIEQREEEKKKNQPPS